MASRRMLDKNFILSDNFTTLPSQAQLLYIHLILNADDEGFVTNANALDRMLGARKRYLPMLQNAGLVHIFDSTVTLILHWHVHNCVRKSTFRTTTCTTEKALVILDSDKIYRLKTDAELTQNCDQPASQDRIGKDRKEKDSIGKESAQPGASGGSLSNNDFDVFWNAYPRKTGRENAEKAFKFIDVPLDRLLTALEAHKKSPQWANDNGAFIPYPATWLKNRRWEDQLPQPIPCGASGQLGEEELASIRKALAEGI